MSGITNYENLANAIVLQAVEDYREDAKKLKRIKSKYVPQDEKSQEKHEETMRKVQVDIDSIERFFRSRWYAELTDVNGEIILRKLREEADAL